MAENQSETPRHTKPDGSAWRKAQLEMAERNDAARRRGGEERSKQERDAANRARLRLNDK